MTICLTNVRTAAIPAPSKKPTTVRAMIAEAEAYETMLSLTLALGRNPIIQSGVGSAFEAVDNLICSTLLSIMDDLRTSVGSNPTDEEARRVKLLQYDLGCDQDVSDVAVSAVAAALPRRFRPDFHS